MRNFYLVKILSTSYLIFECLPFHANCRLPFFQLTLDMSELAPLDPDLLVDVLSKHPFVTIDGVCNVRDLGMVPVADGEYVTRPGFMYRSGELSGVTQRGVFCSFSRAFVVIPRAGMGQLRTLGVTTIFDLRSDTEIAKYDSATPQIAGVTVFRAPVFAKEDYSPERMAQ